MTITMAMTMPHDDNENVRSASSARAHATSMVSEAIHTVEHRSLQASDQAASKTEEQPMFSPSNRTDLPESRRHACLSRTCSPCPATSRFAWGPSLTRERRYEATAIKANALYDDDHRAPVPFADFRCF